MQRERTCLYCGAPFTPARPFTRTQIYCSVQHRWAQAKLVQKEGRSRCPCARPNARTPWHCRCGRWKLSTCPVCDVCLAAVELVA